MAYADMETGKIVFHPSTMTGKSDKQITGIVSHEVQHIKNEAYSHTHEDEMENKDLLWTLAQTDGVSDYSMAVWRQAMEGKVGVKRAIHETLAEIAAMYAEGRKKGTIKAQGKYGPSAEWLKLYNTINADWTEHHNAQAAAL